MNISQAEAASALRDVDAATARTIEMRAYGYASPHLILWGLIWIVGYALMGALPQKDWGWIWLPLDLAGIVGSVMLGQRSRRMKAAAGSATGSGTGPGMGTMMAVMLFVVLFVFAVYAVFAPTTPEPYLVFPAMVVGLVYVAAGAWKMPRLALVGAAVFALSVAGFLFLKPHLAYWIAAVGGGGLVLGGLWLRNV
jgi:hypothetical protein